MHSPHGDDGAAVACDATHERTYGWLGQVTDVSQYQDLVDGLINVVQSQGPFDAIMGFSEGGIIAATLLLEDARRPFANFKCGVFFSAAPPLDPDSLRQGEIRSLNPDMDGISLCVPTAHVFSYEDVSTGVGNSSAQAQSPLSKLWAEAGWTRPEHVHTALVRLCKNAEIFVHEHGHQIPGPKDHQALRGAFRAINRTIERAHG
ncbi:uncharacterized protein E0L32_002619 [Thyridium curvatum]|uniref:Serine hydrolase domain-containing protein n=1 Tax=Thyridium curvatum TaxID=1093900 RepID=A0A507B8X3_9PEZI|nr:uncharacterized protein E0L32_002619 [Thyridium curvatum]TPX18762.1 hypothetical protein E0L32_002619 [Thyridium curvatum]